MSTLCSLEALKFDVLSDESLVETRTREYLIKFHGFPCLTDGQISG